MEVSIIIVNYNTKQLTLNCLKSVYEYTKDIEFEVILVDNASSDGSVQAIAEQYPEVRIIASNENLGFGRANNLGAKYAKGEFLFLLNSDTLLIENAISVLADFLKKNKNVGVCGGNLYNNEMLPATSFAVVKPSVFADINYFFFNILYRIIYKNLYFNHTDKPMKIRGSISGADYMIRKELFDELGGFDSDFFMYYEETELSYRVMKSGYELYNVPEARIIHLEGASEQVKETSLDRTLLSKRLYYQKTSTIFLYYVSNFVFFLTIIQRMIIFKLKGNEKKFQYWKGFYKWSVKKMR